MAMIDPLKTMVPILPPAAPDALRPGTTAPTPPASTGAPPAPSGEGQAPGHVHVPGSPVGLPGSETAPGLASAGAGPAPAGSGDSTAIAAVRALLGLSGSADPDAVRTVVTVARRFPPSLQEEAARAAAWLHTTGRRVTTAGVEALLALQRPAGGTPGLLAPRLVALAALLESEARAGRAPEAPADPVPLPRPSPAQPGVLPRRLRDWGWRPGEADPPEALERLLDEALEALGRGTRPERLRKAGDLAEEVRLILQTARDTERPELAVPYVIPLPVPLPELGGEVLVVRRRQARTGPACPPVEDEVDLYVNTPHLGSIRLTVGGGEAVSVTATAPDPQVRDTLKAALPELAKAFLARGIRPGHLQTALGAAHPPAFPPVPAADLPGRIDRRV